MIPIQYSNTMNKEEKKELFLELRIKGETFMNISEQLEISKQTLINWSKEEEISEQLRLSRTIKYQSLIKQYEVDKEERLKYYLSLHRKIKTELLRRDLSEISPDKLLKMSIQVEERITDMLPVHTFGGEEYFSSIMSAEPSFIFDPKE